MLPIFLKGRVRQQIGQSPRRDLSFRWLERGVPLFPGEACSLNQGLADLVCEEPDSRYLSLWDCLPPPPEQESSCRQHVNEGACVSKSQYILFIKSGAGQNCHAGCSVLITLCSGAARFYCKKEHCCGMC